MSENVGALTSRNPKGLHGLYRNHFTYSHNNKTNYITLHYITARAFHDQNSEI
jgi:hypothetical protein